MASSNPAARRQGSGGSRTSGSIPKTTGAGSKTPSKSSGATGPSTKTASATSSKKISKPSDRLNPKTIDPFSSSRKKSAFAAVYSSGGVPCRLVHGSVKHKLAWDPPPEEVAFDPVLVTLAEGLREMVHPYCFIARQGFKELLEVSGSDQMAIPLLPKVVPALRVALGDPNPAVFEGGLDAVVQLSQAVGAALNPHLKVFLVPMAKRMMEKKYQETVTDALHQLENNGGQDALKLIKSKIPTYSSIFT